jgi:quercetin dioxygenase-like cupin family protein
MRTVIAGHTARRNYFPLKRMVHFANAAGSWLTQLCAGKAHEEALVCEGDGIWSDNMKSDEKSRASKVAHGMVLKSSELVEYQSGAVVSREIVRGKTGSVTLFAFDKGQELSEHRAPFDALAHVLDGEAEIWISGRSHRVQAGEMIIMPANQPHAVKAAGRFKMMLVMIRS